MSLDYRHASILWAAKNIDIVFRLRGKDNPFISNWCTSRVIDDWEYTYIKHINIIPGLADSTLDMYIKPVSNLFTIVNQLGVIF